MSEQPEKLDLTSMDVTEDKKQKLKQLFPEVFREDKIDFKHLKRVLGEWVPEKGREKFGLQWPGKAECMKIIQQPSVASLKPDREESVNFDDTENLFIEGDNLEVLKLLQKSYFGKVKMIYIDPPYNTGNEFIYPDDYKDNLETYLEYTGQKDGEGNWQTTNRDTDGRYHSRWLNMMYSRLFLAKNLLREDGAIFISIDDNELPHLRKLCDEIFGEENFIANIVWQKKQSPQNDATNFSDMHDHILLFSKRKKESKNDELGWDRNLLPRSDDQKSRYSNRDNDPRGPWASVDCTSNKSSEQRPNLYYPVVNPKTEEEVWPSKQRVWRYEEETMQSLLDDERIWWGEDGSNFPRLKRFLSEVQDGIVPSTWWDREFAEDNQSARREIRDLFDDGEVDFDTPKPIQLVQRMLQISTNSNENDIVLDFFAGSCSTAHAVLDFNKRDNGNRRFIMVQLPELLDEESDAYEAGYKNVSDIGKERIRRVIKRINSEEEKGLEESQTKLDLEDEADEEVQLDIGFKVFKLDRSNFKVWDSPEVDIDPDDLEEQLNVFANHISPEAEQESILYELILKSGYPLSTSIEEKEIDDKTIYSIENDALLVYLDEGLTFEILDQMAELEPSRVVCLDKSFSGEQADALKTNAVQLFKSHDIAFRTV
jgi:adenine-specific DNA-methyltransferase